MGPSNNNDNIINNFWKYLAIGGIPASVIITWIFMAGATFSEIKMTVSTHTIEISELKTQVSRVDERVRQQEKSITKMETQLDQIYKSVEEIKQYIKEDRTIGR